MKWVSCLWVLALVAGFWTLLEYDRTPGAAGNALAAWPTASQLVREPGRANLVVAFHPHCPCSRATLSALAQVAIRCRERVTIHALFYKPANGVESWEKTNLWHSAALLPGLTPLSDEEGREAACFGAETSGQVALYSASGTLLFRGGITVSRGHEGGNPGLDALMKCLTDGTPAPGSWPVFGCLLRRSEGIQP